MVTRLLHPKKIIIPPIEKLGNIVLPGTRGKYIYDLYLENRIDGFHQYLIDRDELRNYSKDVIWAIENVSYYHDHLVHKLYKELFSLLKKTYVPKLFTYHENLQGLDLMNVYDNYHPDFIRLLNSTHPKNNNFINDPEIEELEISYPFNLKVEEIRKLLIKIDKMNNTNNKYIKQSHDRWDYRFMEDDD